MPNNFYYKLDGHKIIPCDRAEEWAKWFETANCQVAYTIQNDVKVSTVFLGLNHSFFGRGPPLLFETMAFGGKHDKAQERYSTWEEAEKGHKKMCKKVFGRKYVQS